VRCGALGDEGEVYRVKVFVILVPIFALVGIWLFIYSRKRSGLLKDFAKKRGLTYQGEDEGSYEQILNQAFGLEAPLARGFSGVKDIVTDHEITLFRVTELLDLSPYGISQNTHYGRIAVLFDAPKEPDLFFEIKKQSEYRIIPPEKNLRADKYFLALLKVIDLHPPPHTLSLTMKQGKALLYLIPTVTGSEKETDLDHLYDLAKEISRYLAKGDVQQAT
jgi:hypothetical protein